MFVLACLVMGLWWLRPFILTPLRLDHSAQAVAARLEEAAAADNDIAAIMEAAPRVTLRTALRWFVSGDWLDVRGGGRFWRPLVSLLWWLEYRLLGPNIALYNIVTAVLAAVGAALLAGAVMVLCRSAAVGAAAAGFLLWKASAELSRIFYWFPAQTDVLAGAWMAGALYLAVLGTQKQTPRRWLLVASIGCYVGAALSKGSALVFPIAAAVLLHLRLGPAGRRWVLAYLGVGLALVAARTWILHGAGDFLVPLTMLHLWQRSVWVLTGWWPQRGTEWPMAGAAILVAAALFILWRPQLAQRRWVFYGLLVGVPGLLVLAAHVSLGSALVLLERQAWGQLTGGMVLLMGAALVVRWRRTEGVILAALLVAASAQLVVVPDWIRPHYYYLPAMAWASLNALALGAVYEQARRMRRTPAGA